MDAYKNRKKPGKNNERKRFKVYISSYVIQDDVDEKQLPNMSMEVVVMDKGRFRADQPLGKVSIGPNQTMDKQHWEEMIRQRGQIVKMTHALRAA